ncbi:MAG: transcription antiterminator [Anaerolineaceae bacterium]|nr:transcription antiterminator [Anaerolineaceae bacterium]
MRIYNRKLKILQELINQDGYISSDTLSQKLGVSSRTIRSDIKLLNHELKEQNIILISIPGKGYRLTKKEDAVAYLSNKKKENKDLLSIPKNRIYHIIHTLLFSSNPLTFDDLAESSFVSKSTIENDFMEVENWLNIQNIKLIKKPSVGIQVSADEITLRYAMVNCYSEQFDQFPEPLDNFLSSIILPNQLETILLVLKNIQNSSSIYLSDDDHRHIILYLSITYHRIKNEKNIKTALEIPGDRNAEKEFLIANQMAEQLENQLAIPISKAEVLQLAQYLLQTHLSKIDQAPELNFEQQIDQELVNFIRNTIRISFQNNSDVFLEDDKLIFNLVLYLKSLLNRKANKTRTKVPALNDIKATYPHALEMAVGLSKSILKKFQVNINEDEIGYIALYFCAAIERHKTEKSRNPLKVSLICSSGLAGSQLLAVKIKRYFPDLIIAGIYPSYQLSIALQKKPDFVISTIPLENLEIPVIVVSHLLNDDDYFKIRNFVNKTLEFSKTKSSKSLLNLLNPELFISEIEETTPEEVIQLLCNRLLDQDLVDEHFYQAVLDRETLVSTNIGNLVAIPHALPGHAFGSHISIGILKRPVQWGKEKVQLVFLINIDSSNEQNFSEIFEQLYEIIQSKNTISKLIKAKNLDQFIQIMR